MNFYVIERHRELPTDAKYPCCKLVFDDGWNDYNYKTSFKLTFYSSNKQFDYKVIGLVKIMEPDKKKTILPKSFTQLEEVFCSLGQDNEYYKNVSALNKPAQSELLSGLNDVVYSPGLLEFFENKTPFKTSLIRTNSAEQSLRLGKLYLENISLKTAFQFTFSYRYPSNSNTISVELPFGGNKNIPNRIAAIVGKNATGKTQFLARLALSLGGDDPNYGGTFAPQKPPFSKVVAVSYSAFDKFKRPTPSKDFSYVYCGLKDEKDKLLTQSKLRESYKRATKIIKEKSATEDWKEILSEVVSEEIIDKMYQEYFVDKTSEADAHEDFIFLSSGQNIILYTITNIIAYIRFNSIILFDEPETHLHPNAVASIIRMLHKLLLRYQSFAVIATHSPIILQEIPSQFVSVFEIFEKEALVRKLDIESFGCDLTTLTQKVFNTLEIRGNYKEVLESMAESKSYEQIMKDFDNNLSFGAAAFLKTIYLKKDKLNEESE